MEQILDTADMIQDEVERRFGLTWPQFRIMRVISESKAPKSMGQISDRARCANSTMTTMADVLERAGFVARVRSIEDRRVICLTLTQSGAQRYREVAGYIRVPAPEAVTDYLEQIARPLLKVV